MTSNGHKHFISHPGYGRPEMNRRNDGFVFSDDISRWMGTYKREVQRRDRDRKMKAYKPKRKPKNG